MSTVKLRNNSKRNVLKGMLVRVDPSNPKGFVIVDFNKLEVIGAVAENASPGKIVTISLIRDGFDSEGGNGLSAYELAVQQGYGGSLSQWLDSLQGNDGTPGTPGSDATVTKLAVESVLTGEISSHSHASSGGLTQAQILTRQL